MRQFVVVAILAACVVATPGGQTAPITQSLEIKFVRDSAEYATMARQTYRLATDSVRRAAQGAGRTPWAVVLDLDETVLDNSAYQLERAAYGLPFESASWAAWTERREAAAVPGVFDFIAVVRQLGGHVAWISNRNTAVESPTKANLQALGIWNDDDRLCLQRDSQHTKRMATRIRRPADLPAHLAEEIRLTLGAFSTEDSQEAMRAMAARETPTFTGR